VTTKASDGISWLASRMGPTSLGVETRQRTNRGPVDVVGNQTVVTPERLPGSRQIASALSAVNVHDGVNAIALVGDTIQLRNALVLDPDDKWQANQAMIGMVASAHAAHHLPPELRGRPLGGSGGQSVPTSRLIDNAGTWEVAGHRAADHLFPSNADLYQTVRDYVKGYGRARRSGDLVVVRVPGPNGRLERFIGRGSSDDQDLEISSVTRPPWGAGIKFILRISLGGDLQGNEELAMAVNEHEWELIPRLDVWGGWSGEPTALRLTSFVPQVLLTPHVEVNVDILEAFVASTVNRGEVVASAFGLV